MVFLAQEWWCIGRVVVNCDPKSLALFLISFTIFNLNAFLSDTEVWYCTEYCCCIALQFINLPIGIGNIFNIYLYSLVLAIFSTYIYIHWYWQYFQHIFIFIGIGNIFNIYLYSLVLSIFSTYTYIHWYWEYFQHIFIFIGIGNIFNIYLCSFVLSIFSTYTYIHWYWQYFLC